VIVLDVGVRFDRVAHIGSREVVNITSGSGRRS
jgi:hypothetical protein